MMRLLIAATLLLTACSTAYGEEFYLQVSTEILEKHLGEIKILNNSTSDEKFSSLSECEASLISWLDRLNASIKKSPYGAFVTAPKARGLLAVSCLRVNSALH